LAAIVATVAYFGGAEMARRWAPPTLAQPIVAPVVPSIAPGISLEVGVPVDGVLTATDTEVWRFYGQSGSRITIEMWLHPGSGSSIDAELAVQLWQSDGTLVVSEPGSMFLPPYISGLELPASGLYSIQVIPLSGEPGRFSLVVSDFDGAAAIIPDATMIPLQPTDDVFGDDGIRAPDQFQWPSSRRRISGWTFHDPRNPSHIGLDIAAAMWDPIVAVADGVVVFADWGGGYGNLVIVDHKDGWRSYYAHFEEIAVDVGQNVRQGELLGGAGNTGNSTGAHLHFELRYYGRPVDPYLYLS